MAQFDFFEYGGRKGRAAFLVDVQSDLLADLETRVVVPVYRLKPGQRLVQTLNPTVEHNGETWYLSIPEMAAVRRSELKRPSGSFDHLRDEIIAALGLLFTGI